MASVYLAVQSNRPGASLVTLIDAEPSTTGYKLDRAGGVDLGSATYDRTYSGPRGTQGAVLVGATAQNRLSTWTLQVIGTSEDDLQAKLSALWALDEDLRRYSGTAYWRSWGSSFLMTLSVLDSGVQLLGLDPALWVANHRINVQLGLVTPPYMSGPPMDILDDFSSDTISDYSFDAGAGTLSVSGGQLVPSSTAQKRLYHSARGYTYSDVQLTLRVAVSTAVNGVSTGLIARRLDSANYLYAIAYGVAGSMVIEILKMDGGVSTSLGALTTGVGVTAAGYWVRFRLEGNLLTVELFTSAPTPMGTTSGTTSVVLSGANATKFGAGILGNAGILVDVTPTTWRFDDFDVDPFTYTNRTLPE